MRRSPRARPWASTPARSSRRSTPRAASSSPRRARYGTPFWETLLIGSVLTGGLGGWGGGGFGSGYDSGYQTGYDAGQNAADDQGAGGVGADWGSGDVGGDWGGGDSSGGGDSGGSW